MDDVLHLHILKFRTILAPIGIVAVVSWFFAPGFGLVLLLVVASFGLLSTWRPTWVTPIAVYFSNEIDSVAARILDALLRVVEEDLHRLHSHP